MRAGRDRDLRPTQAKDLTSGIKEEHRRLKPKHRTSGPSASCAASLVKRAAPITVLDSKEGATFSVRVQPRAKRNAIVGEMGSLLKLAVTAPPVEGKANQACIAFFADLLDVPRSSITIAAGETSRNKVICVRGLPAAQVAQRLSAIER